MDEKKEKSVMDYAKELSEVSRNTGKISFKITYTATEGNCEIHKKFQEFCFKNANNEYLAGIGKLLDGANFLTYLLQLEERVELLEQRMVEKDALRNKEKEETTPVETGIKTF